jgi:hypothetical protein
MTSNAKQKRTASGVSTPNNVSNICPLPCFGRAGRRDQHLRPSRQCRGTIALSKRDQFQNCLGSYVCAKLEWQPHHAVEFVEDRCSNLATTALHPRICAALSSWAPSVNPAWGSHIFPSVCNTTQLGDTRLPARKCA